MYKAVLMDINGTIVDYEHRVGRDVVVVSVGGNVRISILGGRQVRRTWLDRFTRRGLFFVLLILIQFLPPYAQRSFSVERWGDIISDTLQVALMYSVPYLYPVFAVASLFAIGFMLWRGNQGARVFAGYAAVSYIVFAVGQNVALTDEYGMSVVTSNVVMFASVAVAWMTEMVQPRTDYKRPDVSIWRYWVVPLAALALWMPLNPETLMPDFNPIYLFTSGSAMAFCMMTPVYLAIMCLLHPRVNAGVMRLTAAVGVVIAIYNLLICFVLAPAELWWNGVLHVPLAVISAYALLLSFSAWSGKGNQ